MFAIHSFYRSVSSKNLLSVFLCCFKKSDALYLLATIWLLLIVIDKFTIIEFAPFSLVTKGVFVTFGKICLYVKSHSFIFSVIPCCLLSFKTERTFPLMFAVVVNTSFAGQINLRFCNFYLVSFLLMLFLFFSLFFKKFTHIEMKVLRHPLFNYLLFTILHKYGKVLGEVVACQHGIYELFRTKIFPRFLEHTKAGTVKRCSVEKSVLKYFANFTR